MGARVADAFSDVGGDGEDVAAVPRGGISGGFRRGWVGRWPDKNVVFLVIAGLLAVLAGGCGGKGEDAAVEGAGTGIYLNDSVIASENNPDVFSGRDLRGGGGTTAGPVTATAENVLEGTGERTWSIMLETFSDENHPRQAEMVRRGMVQELPELADARVQTTSKGSMILWGRYAEVDDPRAQADLKRVKEMRFRGQRVFGKSLLVRVEDVAVESPATGNDLRALRARFPKVKPLYTLQVAAFQSTRDRPLSAEELMRKAAAHAMMLRTQGEEAFYQVDADRGIAVVTVGAFNHTAYDPLSTLYAPEVELLLKKYPKMLVNGEEMLTPIDPNRPKSRKVSMTPKLVEVPG